MALEVLYHHRTRGEHVEGVHIRSIANALRAEGCTVTIQSPPGVDPEAVASASEKTAPVKNPPLLKRLLSAFAARAPELVFELAELAYNLLALWRLSPLLRQGKTDLLYERYSLFLFAGVWLARRRGVPVILEINDSAVMPRVRPLFLQRLARRMEFWIFNRADALVVVSSAFRDQLLAAHGQLAPVIVSPNAADVERFDPARHDRVAERQRLGIGDGLVCGYLGAFIEWHGIHTFIEQLAPQLSAHPQLQLLLVGDGKTRPHVAQVLADAGATGQACLTGNVPHTQVPAMLAAMDFSVLPDSNTYGSPMKLFELMAMGVPVVAPDYGPITEVIVDGETGWLFPAGDLVACRDRVLSLTRADIDRVGANARRYILEYRQWRNNARQLLDFLARQCGDHGA